MRRAIPATILLAALIATASGVAAGAIYKCSVNGTVTYQNDPCPSGGSRKVPTVEQLNTERQRNPQRAAGLPTATPRPVQATPFTCDGRTYCSQMTSCAEAKFFLGRCPATKMDGDRDGIPCEEQWCH